MHKRVIACVRVRVRGVGQVGRPGERVRRHVQRQGSCHVAQGRLVLPPHPTHNTHTQPSTHDALPLVRMFVGASVHLWKWGE